MNIHAVQECAPCILLLLRPNASSRWSTDFEVSCPCNKGFLWYLQVEPAIGTRLLLGKDLGVLPWFGTKTPAWTPNLLEHILNCLKTSYVKQRRSYKQFKLCSSKFGVHAGIFVPNRHNTSKSFPSRSLVLKWWLYMEVPKKTLLQGQQVSKSVIWLDEAFGLKNKAVLKQWIHNIGRLNLTLNDHTGVCSMHFANAWVVVDSSSVGSLHLNGCYMYNRAQHKNEACMVSSWALNYTNNTGTLYLIFSK